MHVWQLTVAAAETLFAVRLMQLLFRGARAWAKSVKTARAFPHRDDWSWIYGTFMKARHDEHFLEVFTRLSVTNADKFKDVCASFLGPMMMTAVTILHPKPLQAVLRETDGKSYEYEYVRSWLGDGLLLSKGAKWHRSRKLLTPAFHFSVLKSYVSVINGATDVLLAKLDSHCRSGKPYWNVTHDIGLAALDIILQCIFSSKTNCQVDRESEYVKAVHELSRLLIDRLTSIPKRSDLLYQFSSEGKRYKEALKIVHFHSMNIIQSRRQTMATSNVEERVSREGDDTKLKSDDRRVDFLEILLSAKDDNGNGMPDEEIRAEVDTFLFEGHDTTTVAISWILYLCAKHPDLQERIRQEVDAIVAGRETDHLTLNDLTELKYTTLFIKEALRLYPPVPVISRCPDRDVQLGSYTVPKGTSININVFAMHHNRHVWGDDVEEFKPERFLLEEGDGVDQGDRYRAFSYIPFSAGSRNCIGQNLAMSELKVTVTRLLRRFIVKPHPTIIPKPTFLIVLRTLETNPILLELQPRL